MNMEISVYEYGIGEKYVNMFRHTYAGIRERKIQMEREDRHIGKVVHTSIDTVTYVSIKCVERETRKQNCG